MNPPPAVVSALRLLKRIRPNVRTDAANLVRAAVAHRPSRAAANLIYSTLPWSLKQLVQSEYRELFLDRDTEAFPGAWKIRFAGRQLRLPLSADRASLDWDMAVSVLGHDVQVKQTYAALLRSSRPPRVFFDIGANFGQHSLLFLAHGVQAISFEPNHECHAYFRDVAALNGLTSDIRPLAMSDSEGITDFWFPEGRTWMGTADAHARDALQREGPLKHFRVQQTTVDAFVDRERVVPDLIKIDAEGSEVRIVQGAHETLTAEGPAVIFESWPGGERERQREVFAEADYSIASLPLLDPAHPKRLSADEFRECAALNFIALPMGPSRLGRPEP